MKAQEVSSRLYQEANEMKNYKEALKDKYKDENLTFKPNITGSSKRYISKGRSMKRLEVHYEESGDERENV